MNLKSLLIFFAVLMTVGCTSSLESAKSSLIGTWKVTEVISIDTASGNSISDDTGIGMIEFTDSQMDYTYSFEGMEFKNDFEYELVSSKVNSGFTNVTRYDITGVDAFEVKFGDQTSDAHKNATEIQLETVTATGSRLIFLSKE